MLTLIPEGHGDGGPALIEYDVQVKGTTKPLAIREGVVVEEPPLETFTPSTDFVVSAAGSVAMPLVLVVAVGATEDVSDTCVTTKTSFVREILGEVDEFGSLDDA